jgi:hypothetical protein
MPTSDEYSKIADEYYRLAREGKTEADRLTLLDLAETWREAASRQDELTPEEIAAAQKLSRASKPEPETRQPQKTPGRWRRLFRLFR